MARLTWSDADEIGYRLSEKLPDIDPLSVRFSDLHTYVVELDGFDDDPKTSTEGLLEAIQMRWQDYHRGG
jgi:FeS assembly protein IscX